MIKHILKTPSKTYDRLIIITIEKEISMQACICKIPCHMSLQENKIWKKFVRQKHYIKKHHLVTISQLINLNGREDRNWVEKEKYWSCTN